jgi:hypothetical protein
MTQAKYKVCSKCKARKPISEFHKSSKNKDGYKYCCKVCRKEYQDRRKDEKAEYDRIYRIINKDAMRDKRTILRGTPDYKEYFHKYWENYYPNNAETLKERSRAWYRENKTKHQNGTYMRKFGMSKADKDNMIKEQGGKCSICGNQLDNARNTHVDHDHKSGFIRGILCNHCNLLLGHAKDDVNILQSAIKYLLDSQQKIITNKYHGGYQTEVVTK